MANCVPLWPGRRAVSKSLCWSACAAAVLTRMCLQYYWRIWKKKKAEKHRSFPFRFHWQEVRFFAWGMSRPSLGTTQSPVQWASQSLSLATKWTGRESVCCILQSPLSQLPIHVRFLHHVLGAGLQYMFTRKWMEGSGNKLQSFN